MKTKVSVMITIDENLLKRTKAIAEQEDRKVSQLVSLAVRKWVEKYESENNGK